MPSVLWLDGNESFTQAWEIPEIAQERERDLILLLGTFSARPKADFCSQIEGTEINWW